MKVAVIPARGGSKRIPRKNIRSFAGKPMIAHSIEAAAASSLFEHIVVSTDDPEIADVAKQFGAEVPFVRPDELSNDVIGTTPIVSHATRWMLDQNWRLDAVCCLYATAPFVQADDIKRGLEAMEQGGWDYAFSVTDFAYPIFRSFRVLPEGGVEIFFPEHIGKRSQDLPEAYHDAGQFYWGRPEAWLEQRPVFGARAFPILIPRWRVQDIDTETDWRCAELMFQALSGRDDG